MKIFETIKKQLADAQRWSAKTTAKDKLIAVKDYFLKASLKKKAVLVIGFLALIFLIRQAAGSSQSAKTTYETAKVEKGTLVSSISGSGTITSGNYTNISTKVSGKVARVFVTNGDKVVKGQKIAEVVLDDYARERQTAAWVAYLEATEAVKDAQTAKWTADIQMWQDRESLLTAIEKNNNNTGNTEGERQVIIKSVDQKRAAFASSELKYKNADSDLANAQAKVSKALRDYQENSATIVAPSAGVVSDLSLAPGLVVNASSTTSSTSGATIVSGQVVGKINDTEGQLIASVSLTEIDIIKVKANQKVTLTLDAYPDKSFTGKVLAVNTSGNISSGVTSYPVTILLDPVTAEVYPNMAASVEIITEIKTDVLLIPSTAVQTLNNQSFVEVKKDGLISSVQIEIGSSNDSQTEIISGLNEGDEVITATIDAQTSNQTQSGASSPFSGIGRSSQSRQRGNQIRFGGPGF
ncbi:MAG: Macrolide export protein MacA [Microgenomates group bacterium ADurb.Bin219]|nr:MAG: Macrolide export protein MacA [Microgenomates group bacterium ADurb.Bin219]HNP89097.1 efflux RND transporter periplasmic adaptor subunit [Candidatus Woesebacteria bacterium]